MVVDPLLLHRVDAVGVITRQRWHIDLLEGVLLREEGDAPAWWRSLADRYESIDGATAERFRGIAAALEAVQA